DQKIDLINKLTASGVNKIETTSFVSPKAVPNLRDASDVMLGVNRHPDVTYTALIPNVYGAKRAVACDVDEVNLVVSVSQTHNWKNVRKNVYESFSEFEDISGMLAGTGVAINGSLATSFGCPFEGKIEDEEVLTLIDRYLELGALGITLADTTGMAT